jgi:hypothetical protein
MQMCDAIKALEPGSVVLRLDSAAQTMSDALFISVCRHAMLSFPSADKAVWLLAAPAMLGHVRSPSAAAGLARH